MPAVFLIGASYAGCDEVLAVVFFVIAVGCHGFDSAGITLNLFDLGPNYVASLNGFVNTLSTVVGILTPYIVSILTPKVSFNQVYLLKRSYFDENSIRNRRCFLNGDLFSG